MELIDAKFFKVHIACSIRGQKMRPGVCYPMQAGLRTTIMKMVADGDAQVFKEEVRIISGRIYPLHGTEDVEQPDRAKVASAPMSPGKAKASGQATSTLSPANAPGTTLRKVTEDKKPSSRKKKDFW